MNKINPQETNDEFKESAKKINAMIFFVIAGSMTVVAIWNFI